MLEAGKLENPSFKSGSRRVEYKPLKNKPKLIILTDSHGRFLSGLLKPYLAHKYQIIGSIYPGAQLQQVLKLGGYLLQELSREDFVVIIAGTNNTIHNHDNNLDELNLGLQELDKLSLVTNVILSFVPNRFDSWENQVLVHKVNRMLLNLKYVIRMIPPTDINFYTKDFIHYNHHGKSELVNNIVHLIKRARDKPFSYAKQEMKKIIQDHHLPVLTNLQQEISTYVSAMKGSKSYNTSTRLYTEVTVGGLAVTALLDSGASHVFIKSDFFYPLQRKGIVIKPINSIAEMANGSTGERCGNYSNQHRAKSLGW